VAAPQLVPLIEAQQQDEHALRHAVGKYIREVRETGADTVVLGCTHYPLVQPLMMETDVYLRYVDPAQCLADKVAADLANETDARVGAAPAPALPESAARGAAAGATPKYTGILQFFNSKPSERFYAMGERVFAREIRSLTKMYIVNPYED
jgi:glutamate racemase